MRMQNLQKTYKKITRKLGSVERRLKTIRKERGEEEDDGLTRVDYDESEV